jgi:2,4-dienoyl-CoA reductase-like NADH-dependent reductase (Old Yellow Enzyme family)
VSEEGAGLITEEMSASTDMACEADRRLSSRGDPSFKKITDYAHQFDARIFAQLNHNGQQCDGSSSGCRSGRPPRCPTSSSAKFPEMERGHREVARYFASASMCAGRFDGIELQFGHSSLARQFLSPLTNFTPTSTAA